MSTPTRRPYNTLTIDGGDPVRITTGLCELDALRFPYATAEVELPLTPELLGDIDPRDDTRIVVRGSSDGGATTREFDLGLRRRVVDDIEKVVRIRAASDEAILTEYAPLVVDSGARAHEGSLRAVVNYVLDKIGAALEAGSADADVTAHWSASNRIPNPAMSNTSRGWVFRNAGTVFGNAGVAAVSSAVPGEPNITHAVRVNGLAASPDQVGLYYNGQNSGVAGSVRGGEELYARAWVKMTQACSMRLLMVYTGVGYAFGPSIAVPANTWTLLTMSDETPANANALGLAAYTTTATGSGLNMEIAGVVVQEGDYPEVGYSGDSPDDADYSYEWAGDPALSESRRTAFVERPPELFTWEPDEKAWRFLEPLLTQAGLRLWCDEQRKWRLIDPAQYTLDNQVTISGLNTTRGLDTIDRDDPEVFATGVAVRFTWKDATGRENVAFDVAGTPEKVVSFEYERPYPGPGTAAAILARRNGTGRTQEVTALIAWSTTPAQVAAITLPTAPTVEGKVQSVRFDLGNDALMDVGTRQLIDVPEGSWLSIPPDYSWDDIAPGVSWDDWTW